MSTNTSAAGRGKIDRTAAFESVSMSGAGAKRTFIANNAFELVTDED
jgi:hypothetical protein